MERKGQQVICSLGFAIGAVAILVPIKDKITTVSDWGIIIVGCVILGAAFIYLALIGKWNDDDEKRKRASEVEKWRGNALSSAASLRALVKRKETEYPQFKEHQLKLPAELHVHPTWKKHFDKIFEYMDDELKKLEKLDDSQKG